MGRSGCLVDFVFPTVGYGCHSGGGGDCVGRSGWLVDFFFPTIGCGCHSGGGGGGCGLFLKFVVDVFIIILVSSLYYFNQIAKNIDPLILGVLYKWRGKIYKMTFVSAK